MYRGNGITKEQICDVGISCVRYGEIYTTYNIWFDNCVSHTNIKFINNPRYFEKGDILFAITGERVEDIAKSVAYVGNDKCIAGGDIIVLKHNQNPKYLAYALDTSNAKKQKQDGKVKSKVVHSNISSISNIIIPLPPLEEQNIIAEIIDKLNKYCNDLEEGLLAEIEVRKKQYEYYRDKLLTFK
ncbi:MAG: restriction endonuclease subunit S [Erysipelotrichales bacterium]|nr:restriction endonuclease subunit S [Erysipelotrichales bacterium]